MEEGDAQVQGIRVHAVGTPGERLTLAAAPDVLTALGLQPGQRISLAFGLRSASVSVSQEPEVPPGTIAITQPVATELLFPLPGPTGLYRNQDGLRFGPLVAVLISVRKLNSVLSGDEDTVYLRYRRYAGEVGAMLCFFTTAGVNPGAESVEAYRLAEHGWEALRLPLPRVVYDRCFGATGRAEAQLLRQIAAQKGMAVVNRPVKITKLETFALLSQKPELRPYLPLTLPLSPRSLAACLDQHPVVYLKPDSLYKGQGVFRVTRLGAGWQVQASPDGPGEAGAPLTVSDLDAVLQLLPSGLPYLVQAGIPLATYLGNPYDFRSLVQKAGGCWHLTGLVARIAPEGGVVTSPRSGGLVSPAERVLCHSFGREQGLRTLTDLEAVSLAIANHVEEGMGRCVELGLDLGVTTDGRVQLIEVNGKPLKVSLMRMADPGVTARINRFPIHAVAQLDLVL